MMRSLLSILAAAVLFLSPGCKAEPPQSVKGASKNLSFKEIPREFCILSVAKDEKKRAFTIKYQVANLGKEPLLHLKFPTFTEGLYRGPEGDLPSWTSMAELRSPRAIDVVVIKPGEVRQLTINEPFVWEKRVGPSLSVRLAIHPWSLDDLEGGYPKRPWTKSMTWPKKELVSQELDLQTGWIVRPTLDQ